ncbi:hypothetical protein [Paractinoplanes rishiriensis]|uniref:Uncharacterized protein n=1 Tax=Paractinoplanes rishiriensis TaxID=1050105 RepID=A0A919K4K4_9ACTN|nr:hypothetical protein [Actinoplanes rishiriensis]GIE98463.1 hypothetical protein Ari01nite_59280 [Actinoplanes rishiriensis]
MRLSMRRRRELELRDAMADAWAAARVTGGQFRQLGPVYADRLGLAYQVLRGRQLRRMGKAFALTAVLAAVGGAATALIAERALAARRTPEEEPVEAATPIAVTDSAPVSTT